MHINKTSKNADLLDLFLLTNWVGEYTSNRSYILMTIKCPSTCAFYRVLIWIVELSIKNAFSLKQGILKLNNTIQPIFNHCSISIYPEIIRIPWAFWCFQWIKKWNIGWKRLTFLRNIFEEMVEHKDYWWRKTLFRIAILL